jgi:hypothetical protein
MDDANTESTQSISGGGIPRRSHGIEVDVVDNEKDRDDYDSR